jgi:hypothetical protein
MFDSKDVVKGSMNSLVFINAGECEVSGRRRQLLVLLLLLKLVIVLISYDKRR